MGGIRKQFRKEFKAKVALEATKGLDQGRTKDEELAPERKSLNKKLENFSKIQYEKPVPAIIESARKYLNNIFSSK